MPVLKCSDELRPFFNELPMPKGLNGNEQSFNSFPIGQPFALNVSAMEVFRRMQDCHDSINEGRFFLCLAQRKSFPEIYKEPIYEWCNDWVKSQFVISSLHSYNASFDLFLQVLWIYYKLYQTTFPSVSEITNENLSKILKGCKIEIFKKKDSQKIIGDTVFNAINNFCDTPCYKEIHDLCNAIKHRQRIEFIELAKDKHGLLLINDNYNSHDSLLKKSISEVINNLKNFHKELSKLSNICMHLITYQD